jgi:polar amino acid transport system ATP-binding protein
MDSNSGPPCLPVIDLSLFDMGDPWRDQVAAEIDAASSEFGFFCLVGHGIDAGLVEPLLAAGRRFFATEDAVQRRVQVARHARARQGAFAPVEELAARSSHLKHLYFEAQFMLGDNPLQPGAAASRQTFLPDVPGFRDPVLDYMRSLTGLSHKVMAMLARALRLADSYFVDRYTGSPATSFRILNYPQLADSRAATDDSASGREEPGLLTILKQDSSGGLELNYRQRWVELPAMPNSFICNVGQALARVTNGRYVAAAHRVRNSTDTHRLSMSFGFEPALNATLEPIAGVAPASSRPSPARDASNALPAPDHRRSA